MLVRRRRSGRSWSGSVSSCARGSRAGPRWRVGPTFGNSIVGFKCVSCLFIQKEMFEKRASCFSFRKRYFSSIKTMFSKNVFKFWKTSDETFVTFVSKSKWVSGCVDIYVRCFKNVFHVFFHSERDNLHLLKQCENLCWNLFHGEWIYLLEEPPGGRARLSRRRRPRAPRAPAHADAAPPAAGVVLIESASSCLLG